MPAVPVVLAVLFLLSGVSKLIRHPVSVAARDKLAVPAPAWSLTGAAELAGAAGVLVGVSVRPLGIAAAGLVFVGAGAVAAHRKAHGSLSDAAPAVVAVLLAIAALALFSTGA